MTAPSPLRLPRVLDGGLILRQATEHDAERLAAFNAAIHGEPRMVPTVRDLMNGRHPIVRAADFLLVEDPTRKHAIVSSLCLIGQLWRYDGITLAVGQPELVGTDPAYRRRGLVRALFEAIHALSAAHGDAVQAITGIPWFYRQFGYEYALDLGGSRRLPLASVPALAAGETEAYHIRPATADDLPALMAIYAGGAASYRTSNVLGPDDWDYDLAGRSPDAYFAMRLLTIEDAAGQIAGYCRTRTGAEGDSLIVLEVWTASGTPLAAPLPALLRALQRMAAEAGPDVRTLAFGLGGEHPLYHALDSQLLPLRPPYAFYLRVADLPALVAQLGPALQRRLDHTPLSGYSGALRLGFYQYGLRLDFQAGRLMAVTGLDAAAVADEDWVDAAFPPGVFLKLLFGYRSLDELRRAYPDVRGKEEAFLLLEMLFPPAPSRILPRL